MPRVPLRTLTHSSANCVACSVPSANSMHSPITPEMSQDTMAPVGPANSSLEEESSLYSELLDELPSLFSLAGQTVEGMLLISIFQFSPSHS